MTHTLLKIEAVEEPLPRCSLWRGKARTARRSYKWYFSENDGRIAVMANRPEGSDYYWYLRTVPTAFKAEIKRAVTAAKGGAAWTVFGCFLARRHPAGFAVETNTRFFT